MSLKAKDLIKLALNRKKPVVTEPVRNDTSFITVYSKAFGLAVLTALPLIDDEEQLTVLLSHFTQLKGETELRLAEVRQRIMDEYDEEEE